MKGILHGRGFLHGPPQTEDARFGMAISAIPDLDLDGFNDVVVGAPLEERGKGLIYIYNGQKKLLNTEFSQVQQQTRNSCVAYTFLIIHVKIRFSLCFQKILGSSLDPQLKYFGRSLDSYKDLNGDKLPDISVGAYGKAVQLW